MNPALCPLTIEFAPSFEQVQGYLAQGYTSVTWAAEGGVYKAWFGTFHTKDGERFVVWVSFTLKVKGGEPIQLDGAVSPNLPYTEWSSMLAILLNHAYDQKFYAESYPVNHDERLN